MSEIWATQGVITEMNAPEKKPYTAANSMSEMRDFVNIQNTRQERPEKNAEGVRRLKRPTVSDRYAGAIRPNTPPAFITAKT
jgi:hypothetical protein